MSVYAIGDVQGCYGTLQELLDKIGFDPSADRLWFAGDLVNRGPQSLAVLRFVHGLGARAVTVLGNHDLHLLAARYAREAPRRRHDTFGEVLRAPDCDELLDWLRQRPLLHHNADLNYTMLHAGLIPAWDLDTARARAAEVENTLRSGDYSGFFDHMYGNEPDQWSERLQGWERLRFITNCFTRLRYCDEHGRMLLEAAGPPGSQPAPFRPWFEIPGRASRNLRIAFGHWAALQAHAEPNLYHIDTGCVWGGELTALRLENPPTRTSVVCQPQTPTDTA